VLFSDESSLLADSSEVLLVFEPSGVDSVVAQLKEVMNTKNNSDDIMNDLKVTKILLDARLFWFLENRQ